MEVIAVIVGILIVLGIGLTLFSTTSPKSIQNEHPSPSLTSVDFIPSQMYQDSATGTGLAINEETNTMCLLRSVSTIPQLVPCTSLVGSVLVKNGTVLEAKWRTGPEKLEAQARELEKKVRLAIGNENTPSSQRNSEQKIDVCIIVNDEENPIHIVNFLDMDAKEGGVIYEKALSNAQHWYTLLSNLIEQNSNVVVNATLCNTSVRKGLTHTTLSSSVGDELTKLSVLLDKQLITQEEFNTQKEKLLAGA